MGWFWLIWVFDSGCACVIDLFVCVCFFFGSKFIVVGILFYCVKN